MAPQKEVPMSMIEKHYQKLETESKSMDQACTQAVDKVKEDFEKKRSELKGRLEKLKTGEQELIKSFKELDSKLQQELATDVGAQTTAPGTTPQTIGTPALAAASQPPAPAALGQDPLANPTALATAQSPSQAPAADAPPDQQLLTIFVETNREIEKVIRDYKEKLKSAMGNSVPATSPTNTSPGTGGGANINHINAFIESREKSLKDQTHKLEKYRNKIDKYWKKLEDIEAKEATEMVQAEKKCCNEEKEERKSESDKLVKKAKEVLEK